MATLQAGSCLPHSAQEDSCHTVHRRNIVILGRAGVGKAAIVNAITRKETFAVGSSIESTTREARCETKREMIELKRGTEMEMIDQYDCQFLLIDTVAQQKSTLQNDEIRKTFHTALEKDFGGGIRLLVFVLKRGQEDETETHELKRIISWLQKSASECCALVVTGCENLKKSAEDAYKEKLRTSELTRRIIEFVPKDNLLLVSLPNIEELDDEMKEGMMAKKDSSRDELQQFLITRPRRPFFPKELFRGTDNLEEDKAFVGPGTGTQTDRFSLRRFISNCRFL